MPHNGEKPALPLSTVDGDVAGTAKPYPRKYVFWGTFAFCIVAWVIVFLVWMHYA